MRNQAIRQVTALVTFLTTIHIAPAGTWQPLANDPPLNGTNKLRAETGMYLLTDGSVLVPDHHLDQRILGRRWLRFRPDANGNYVSGTWTVAQDSADQHGYAPSATLVTDGSLAFFGGEYSNALPEAFVPQTNTWRQLSAPSFTLDEGPNMVLADGRFIYSYPFLDGAVLRARCASFQTSASNPLGTWTDLPDRIETAGPSIPEETIHEEGYGLLQDGTVLCLDFANPTSPYPWERLNPATNTWQQYGMSFFLGGYFYPIYEVGPALCLPDGRLFWAGGNSNTGIFEPASSSWVQGPTIPNGYFAEDAWGCLLPNGHVFFATEFDKSDGPVRFMEYDPAGAANPPGTLSVVPGPNEVNNFPNSTTPMLLLPTGQVMVCTNGFVLGSPDPHYYIYTPSNTSFNNAWRPTITSVNTTLTAGHTNYQLTGTQLHGLSVGSDMGDDCHPATNYPLIRLTQKNVSNPNVYYCRTYNYSTMSIAPNVSSTTRFDVPATVPSGQYNLQVVANGIPSVDLAVTVIGLAEG